MIEVQPGDLAVVQDNTILGPMVRWGERAFMDDAGVFDHGFIITSTNGQIIESKLTFRYAQLSQYIGCKIFIVRHKEMTPERFAAGMAVITPDLGKLYPAWRLPLYILGLERFFNKGIGVCVEQEGRFMQGAGFQHIVYGITPDDLAELWNETILQGRMIVVCDGILEQKGFQNVELVIRKFNGSISKGFSGDFA